MRVALISLGEDYSLTKEEWADRKDYWTGLASLAIAFNGDVLNTLQASDLGGYDIVIANADLSAVPKLLKLREGFKGKWVSVIERCASDYMDADADTLFLLDTSDLINVINKNTVDYFRSLTRARCEYIGIPFPAEQIRARFFSLHREKRIMLPPYVDPPFKNHNASLFTVLRLGPVGFEIVQATNEQVAMGPYRTIAKTPPIEYMGTVSRSFAFVNLDHRYTWGRTVLECAALGVPCIATESTGHAEDFFPRLMVKNQFSVDDAQYKLQRLIDDEYFYGHCEIVDMDKFQPYTHEAIRKKILDALN